MKRFSFIVFLLLCSLFGNAQFMQFSEGPTFPDPGNGFAKILQMKNYSTLFIHVSFDKGITVQAYEPKYKAKTETLIEPAYGVLQAGNVEGIFEVNGDAVVFVSNAGKTETDLYRLIINAETGKLKEEQKIASVKKVQMKKAVAQLPDVSVRKDPASDNYAVAMFRAFESDTSKRVEVVLYGNDHREINRGSYTAPQEKYKYLQYLDMAVIGADAKVSVLLYGYNVEASNEKIGDVVLANLDKDSKSISLNELYVSNDLVIEKGITRFEPQSKRLLFLTTATVKSESNNPGAFLGIIDPHSKKLITNNAISAGEKVQEKYAQLFGKNAVYSGVPQNLFLNNDESYTVIFEEMEFAKENDTTSRTLLRNTAVATYNKEGEIVSSYLIPFDHYVSNVQVPAFYQSVRDISGQQFLKDNPYKSSTYISDGHNSFILFNDNEVNGQQLTGKLKRFKELTDADAFYCLLAGKEVAPKHQYVFGKPVTTATKIGLQHKLGLFTVYDYDKMNNIFVVLKQDKEDSQHPGVRLVWLQP